MNTFFFHFMFFSFLHTCFYTIWSNDIFEWNADPGDRDNLKTKRDIIDGKHEKDKPPLAWKIERTLHVFLGMLLGWLMVWLLLNRHGIFETQRQLTNFDISDLILFVGGYIGINGRLPTIAHDVQNWFKR